MSEHIKFSSKFSKYNLSIIVLGVFTLVYSLGMRYVNGESENRLLHQLIGWCHTFTFTFIIAKFSHLLLVTSGRIFFKYLANFTFVFFLCYMVLEPLTIGIYPWILHTVATIIYIILAVILASNFGKIYLISIGTNISAIQAYSENETEDLKYVGEQKNGLGKGNSTLDRVIQSICGRAASSVKMNTLSLITIIVIVVVGVTASFGTVALNEAQKIREIEKERTKLTMLIRELEKTSTIGYSKLEISNILKNYGNDKEYSQIIKDSLQQEFDWIDIAMRATIALLTIFLVQIFFHIYKFNQHHASHLFSKAETLELFKNEGADEHHLRRTLLAKLESAPAYGQSPPAPTDQIIEAIQKFKK